MTRATLILNCAANREKAARWVAKLPTGTRVDFKEPKRTLPQNSRMWAMLTDLSEQLAWHGLRLTPDDWKLVFLDALKREVRIVPNIDGNGFVNLGRSSSDLSVAEMTDLMELIAAFGANHSVKFQDSPDQPTPQVDGRADRPDADLAGPASGQQFESSAVTSPSLADGVGGGDGVGQAPSPPLPTRRREPA